MGHGRSAQIPGEQNRSQKRGSRDQKEDRNHDLQDADFHDEFGGKPDLFEHLGFAFPLGKFATGTQANEHRGEQAGQNPTDNALCFGAERHGGAFDVGRGRNELRCAETVRRG